MSRDRVVWAGAALSGALLVSIWAPTRQAAAQIHEYKLRGRWTNQIPQWSTTTTDSGGTHVAVLRGNADTTWVLHWHDGTDERIWLAKTELPKVEVQPPSLFRSH